MNCYNHPYIVAVAHCECGKALCSSCSRQYNIPICDYCANLRMNSIRQEQSSYYIKCYIFSILLFIWGFYTNQSILFGLFVGCAPWGWSALNKITPNIFLVMSWFGWLIYYIIKLALASVIGIFIAPFQFYKSIKFFYNN